MSQIHHVNVITLWLNCPVRASPCWSMFLNVLSCHNLQCGGIHSQKWSLNHNSWQCGVEAHGKEVATRGSESVQRVYMYIFSRNQAHWNSLPMVQLIAIT